MSYPSASEPTGPTLPAPEMRVTFEDTYGGASAPNDIVDYDDNGVAVSVTFSSVTPVGTTAKEGSKVANLGDSESAPTNKIQIRNNSTYPYSLISTHGYMITLWWYYVPSDSTFETLVTTQYYSGSNGGYNMYYYPSTDEFLMYVDKGDLMYRSDCTLTTNTWYFIAFFVDNTRSGVKMYVDGSLLAQNTKDVDVTSFTHTSGQYLNIGSHSGGSATLDSDQYIDDLRIYNRELSSSEVESLYNSY